jgi:Zn-dependent protease with chaperone function
MKKSFRGNLKKNLAAMSLMWAMLILPLAAFGQTRVSAPKNNTPIQRDVQAGRQAAAQVEQQMPVLNDAESTRYLQQVGQRLVNAIPAEFQHPEFQYTFKIVNARDINAFALPGGPMYVNRGMIEAARNEGEMAGVMAHEISHVALRHGTAPKASGLSQVLGIGAILGGAILGGNAGAQAGAIANQALTTPYSREYEKQADLLGAQIMARAGYDPRDLANMFQTIARQGGGSGPQFLSTHPNPENRFETINREAQMLRVSSEPIKLTAGFQRAQSRLRGSGAPPTAGQGGAVNATSSGTYSNSVPLPSARATTYNSGGLYVNYPNNWQSLPGQNSVMFAPQGAYGSNGISHGVMIGVSQGSGNLQQDASALAQQFAQQNGYQTTSNFVRTTFNGRTGLAISMRGQSNITNAVETATLYTAQTQNGSLIYAVTVAPQNQVARYNSAFSTVVRSVRYN